MFEKLCGAKARTNGHQPCRQPAMANGRCRLHGGKCTGPKTAKGKERLKQVNTKHGFYSVEAQKERLLVKHLINHSKESL